MWSSYGIFKPNEYKDQRTGLFKQTAFAKTLAGSALLCMVAIKLIFDRIFDSGPQTVENQGLFHSINWPFIFCLTPCLLLILRHFIFAHRVSWPQMIAGLFSILSLLLMIFFQNQLLLKAQPKVAEPEKKGKKYDTKIFGLFYDLSISALFAFMFIIMKDVKASYVISYRTQVSAIVYIMGIVAVFLQMCRLISGSSSKENKETAEDGADDAKVDEAGKDYFSDELLCYIFVSVSGLFFVSGQVMFS